jgi:putative nucleotidyltransferase with HDIG domain
MADYIRDRIAQIEFLPSLPGIAGEVMKVIEDPRSSASDLVRHLDPSLAGEVLKAANSAYCGKKNFRHIESVEQAVAAIGYSGLSSIILHTPLLSMIDGEDTLFDRNGFVRHSLSCAVLAETVASAFALGNPKAAHLSGMLHDIGIIIVYQFFKEEWRKINVLMEQRAWGRPEAERAVLGMDHANIGSMLLELWDLPETILESVRFHHLREEGGERGELYAIWLADNLAMQIDFDKDFMDFETFFRKQREFLQSEMPERYLLNHDVDLFETAYDKLKEIESVWGSLFGGEG